MISRFSYFFFLLSFLPLATIHSAGLDDLETRIDQMLERLNKVEPTHSKKVTPEPLPEIDPEMETEMGLPTVPLPSSQADTKTPSDSETSQALNQLENRIDNLLRRLNMESSPLAETPAQVKKQPRVDAPKPQKLSKSENPPNSFALPDELGEQNFDPPPLPKNRFNFYLGLSLPGDSVYSDSSGNHDTEFGNGFELGLDYNRMFEDGSYIGAFVEGKFFDTERIKGISTTGDNRLVNLGFTLGQDWGLSDQLVVKTQASMGGALTNYEIDAVHYSVKDFTFYYSFLLGLEFKWNESWQMSVYYELDGRASADRIDYQSFHQLGASVGIHF